MILCTKTKRNKKNDVTGGVDFVLGFGCTWLVVSRCALADPVRPSHTTTEAYITENKTPSPNIILYYLIILLKYHRYFNLF